MTTEQYVRLEELLLQILHNQKPPRTIVGVSPRTRDAEVIRVFNVISSYDIDQRIKYRFAQALIPVADENGDILPLPVVPLSMMLNRLEQIKDFRKLDGEISPRINAINALANRKDLVMTTLGDLNLQRNSELQVVTTKAFSLQKREAPERDFSDEAPDGVPVVVPVPVKVTVKEDPFDKLIREQAEDQDDSEVVDCTETDEDAFVEEEDDTPPPSKSSGTALTAETKAIKFDWNKK